MGYFTIQADYSELEREIRRISAAPGMGGIAKLEETLARSFADATARVHVITGALRGSGKTASEADAEGSWEGQMTWGGPSPGFLPKADSGHRREEKNPEKDELARNEVVYAFYEKRRGGAHDYLGEEARYSEDFLRAVGDIVRGAGA